MAVESTMPERAEDETTDAVSASQSAAWHDIDWFKVNREVRRLQARIVKATESGHWRKVKHLQWLLTHSFSGKALAVRRVTENKGKKTPGVDGETWNTPELKTLAIGRLKRRGYKPLPLRRHNIPKPNGKTRPLGIPTMTDRAMQALYKLALEPVAECHADGNSYGFRVERSCHDALQHAWTALNQRRSAQWVLEGDIKGCFDNISHDWIIENVPMDKTMLRKWLKCGVMDNGVFMETDAGTPQGGIISPTLANYVLDGLQPILAKKFGSKGGSTRKMVKNKVLLIRYADDFIITGTSKRLLEEEVLPIVHDFMHERGLTLSSEKTKITHVRDGFDFLGQNVRRYQGKQGQKWFKLLVMPSDKAIKSHMDKIRKIIKSHPTVKQIDLIYMLNKVIRGWANYQRRCSAKQVFSWMDKEVYLALWKWACRRHPKKGTKWVKERYFHVQGTRNWVFGIPTGRWYADGTPEIARVLRYSDFPIEYHTKIQSEVNPFDPKWEEYLEKRLGVKMEKSLAGKRKLLYIWNRQGGKCPICKEPIDKITGWHLHHLVRRVDGGKDTADNLAMLHPNCHRQVHSNPEVRKLLGGEDESLPYDEADSADAA